MMAQDAQSYSLEASGFTLLLRHEAQCRRSAELAATVAAREALQNAASELERRAYDIAASLLSEPTFMIRDSAPLSAREGAPSRTDARQHPCSRSPQARESEGAGQRLMTMAMPSTMVAKATWTLSSS